MTLTVYTKKGCKHCQTFISVAQFSELQHVVYELGRDFSEEEFYTEFGEGATFPQVVQDSIPLGGCVESIKALKEQELCCMI